jgi:23S rRNA (guanosine2251-2'-O)-methyltransferase
MPANLELKTQNSELPDSLYVVGRRAALELLKSDEGRERIEKLYIAHGVQEGPQIAEILHYARAHKVTLGELDRRKFEDLEKRNAKGVDSQGVIILLRGVKYYELEEILGEGRTKATAPLLIALDGIEDPHNIGAIIRSAEAAGADAVLLPTRGAVLTPAVFKTSAGAALHLPIVKYSNLPEIMFRLREEFFLTCFGLDGNATQTIYDADFSGGICLLVGGEEKGLHHLVRKRCDTLVKIPLTGKTASLNASVASAIGLFEVCRQRTVIAQD